MEDAPVAVAAAPAAVAATGKVTAPRGQRLAVLLGVGGLVFLYAMLGGAYDTVTRGTLAIVVWWAIALGIGAGVLRLSRVRSGARLVIGALALLALVTLVATGWTESVERTLIESARVTHHLGIFILVLLVVRPRTAAAAGAGLAIAAL